MWDCARNLIATDEIYTFEPKQYENEVQESPLVESKIHYSIARCTTVVVILMQGNIEVDRLNKAS